MTESHDVAAIAERMEAEIVARALRSKREEFDKLYQKHEIINPDLLWVDWDKEIAVIKALPDAVAVAGETNVDRTVTQGGRLPIFREVLIGDKEPQVISDETQVRAALKQMGRNERYINDIITILHDAQIRGIHLAGWEAFDINGRLIKTCDEIRPFDGHAGRHLASRVIITRTHNSSGQEIEWREHTFSQIPKSMGVRQKIKTYDNTSGTEFTSALLEYFLEHQPLAARLVSITTEQFDQEFSTHDKVTFNKDHRPTSRNTWRFRDGRYETLDTRYTTLKQAPTITGIVEETIKISHMINGQIVDAITLNNPLF